MYRKTLTFYARDFFDLHPLRIYPNVQVIEEGWIGNRIY
jgi:hypothetical protein